MDPLTLLLAAAVAVLLIRSFLPAYLQEKGKNLATQEDIQEITEAVEKVRAAHSSELERLRAELQARTQLLTSSLSIGAAGYLAAQERRLESIDQLWQAVLQVREGISSVLTFYDILVPEEYDRAATHTDLRHILPKNDFDFMAQFPSADLLEVHRPYLGERLWVYFWVYRAFCGRLGLRLGQGRERGRIPKWNIEDRGSYTTDLLRYVLDQREVQWLESLTIGGPRRAAELIEQKMLVEIDRRISGSTAAEVSIEEGKRLAEALWQAQRQVSSQPGA